MSVILTVNGVPFEYPETGDSDWGNQATLWASAITSGMLQKAGGTFTLTSPVDFGANFGIVSTYFSSRTNATTDVGVLRLARPDVIAWSNQNNDNHLDLGPNSDDSLTYDGTRVAITRFTLDGNTSISLAQTQYGSTVLCFTNSNPCLVTLPAPFDGLEFTIKDRNGFASARNITVDPGVYAIDGSTTDRVINTNYGYLKLISDGGAWFIVGAA